MADNSTLPGTGDVYASDDVGGVKYPRVKLVFGADAAVGADVEATAGKGYPVRAIDGELVTLGAKADAKSAATDTTAITAQQILKQLSYSLQAQARLIQATAGTITRPANVTAYTANDAVSDNATAASVTSQTVILSDTNDEPISVERIRIVSTDTGVAGKAFRVYLYSADPTASTGVVGGDNAAFSTKRGVCVGTFVGTFKTFSDGSIALCSSEDGSRVITTPVSGAKTLYLLLQTLNDFTPSANSTTFICTFEAQQGRA